MQQLKKLVLILAFCLAPTAFAAQNPIDINTADAKTIAAVMHGVGPAKAAAIVLYREERGPFKDIHELTRVRGIGKATIARNKDVIQIGPMQKSE